MVISNTISHTFSFKRSDSDVHTASDRKTNNDIQTKESEHRTVIQRVNETKNE